MPTISSALLIDIVEFVYSSQGGTYVFVGVMLLLDDRVFAVAIRADDTTFTNLRTKLLGSPTITVGEEFGDAILFLARLDVVELKNPRIPLATVAAAFRRHVFQRPYTGIATGATLVGGIGLPLLAIRSRLRINFSSSVGLKIGVDLCSTRCPCAFLAVFPVSLWIGGTFFPPLTYECKVCQTLLYIARLANLEVVELIIVRLPGSRLLRRSRR
jgi:hypothetical protein